MTSYPTDPRRATLSVPDYDALAELFLGAAPTAHSPAEPKPAAHSPEPPLRLAGLHADPEPTRVAPARDAARAVVDAVILGSLPVYASAWLLQHARIQAEQAGAPVALVRILSGECSVDVVGVPPDAMPERAPASLDDALAFVGASCARVLLRTGETSEHDLASHAAVGSITILTGVDDPALVAAYRTIKAIHACEKPVRVATMGAPLADAKRAFEKISRASSAFLETPVEFAGHVERIEPAPTVCLHRSVSRASIEAILDALSRAPAPAREEAPATVEAPEDSEPRQDAAEPAPAPRIDQALPAVAEAQAPPLATRVKGLAPTPIRAPRCEGVEVAVDARGRVHLLLADTHDADSRGAVATLLAAHAWAQTNASLLAAACATILGAPVDEAATPAMHLFTSDPRRVRTLLDADIRLHLLAPVEVDGRRAWCVAELN